MNQESTSQSSVSQSTLRNNFPFEKKHTRITTTTKPNDFPKVNLFEKNHLGGSFWGYFK